MTKHYHNADIAEGITSPLSMYSQILTSSRNGGKCEYPSGLRPSNAHSSLIALQAQQRVVQQSFPPSFFLDMNIFRQARLELPRPSLAVPAYVSDFLGGDEEVRQMVTTFFSNVYAYMPCISKNWIYQHLLSPLTPVHADSTLLLLSMQLINWTPTASESPKSPAYIAAKQFFFELENAGNLSIRLVQAGIFIALYELGHCIYPAAYMSVGTCARHAVALGLDKDIKQNNATGLPWDDIEERRRVWWAILILDRYALFKWSILMGLRPQISSFIQPVIYLADVFERFINLGNPPRMLATADPATGDILPADDISWDQGVCIGYRSNDLQSDGYLVVAYDRIIHHRIPGTITNGTIRTICSGNISFRTSYQTCL